MDVAEAIDAEAVTVTYADVATAGGSYVHGKWVASAAAPGNIQAAIQPASGRQLMDLPEGVRSDASFVGWSRTAVKVNGTIGYDGKSWRIVFVWPRPQDGFTRFAMGEK